MGQLAELEIDQDEGAEQAVVEDEVDVEVVAVDGEALLARDEAEAFAELEEERLEAVDDRLLEVALERRGTALEVEKLEDEGSLMTSRAVATS